MNTPAQMPEPHDRDRAVGRTRPADAPGVLGYRRSKQTSRAVLWADRLAERTITVGGIGVIAAVMGILVFLVAETLPLFRGGELRGQAAYRVELPEAPALTLAVDEYRALAADVAADGTVTVFHVPTGTALASRRFDLGGGRVTGFGRTPDGSHVAFGFADGSVRFGRLEFDSAVLPGGALPSDAAALSDTAWTDGAKVYRVLPGDQLLALGLGLHLEEPVAGSPSGAPVVALDYRLGGTPERPTRAFVVVDARGAATLTLAKSKRNLMTGKVTRRLRRVQLPPLPAGAKVFRALLNEAATTVYLAEADGTVHRYNTHSFDQPFLAETVRVTPPGADLTAIEFLLGQNALVVGGADGSVGVHFRVNAEDAGTPDGVKLVHARTLPPHRAAVTRVDTSQRGKVFVTAAADGEVLVRHATSEKTLLRLRAGAGGYRGLRLAPREDGLLALLPDGAATYWALSIPHPETSLRTLFGKVWYEGYPEPGYTWQSTGMTDGFEPKLSLVPLIFGTLKGTVYSMLFAVPIALLAAIYTSEFVHPRVRGVVKPAMEMMASVPSVVLGFVAALVLAPIVETWIAAVLLAFLVVPGCLLGGAYLWQFLPIRVANRYGGVPKMLLILALVLLGAWGAVALGPVFENAFFAGDFKVWVSGRGESTLPFLFLLLLPLSLVLAGLAMARLVGGRVHARMRGAGTLGAAALDLARWVATCGLACGVSFALAALLDAVGLDPRGTFVGTYAQRNTLVIAFAMGFAVIPIIYTLAEDALNAVPEHLRSASLGCGATPWQTAMWVIVPTAMSGVFSGIMVGMGRAVGETMIVVMAAGNTPLLDWNVFNGLRALSANIAVELPEAVHGATLYRTLFLSALVLFAMTFALNTAAEVIRQRFRRRSMQL